MKLISIHIGRIFFVYAIIFMFGNRVAAQIKDDTGITEKFIQYQQDHLHEKIYVHTDKDFYLAGETVWFKIYITDAFFNRPLPMSKIAYVEMINNKGPLLQSAIDINGNSATGNGSFTIPVSALSGEYIFTAYTNWMKNYNDVFFFRKKITIVNTLNNYLTNSEPGKDTVVIKFYPEGGNLVNGLQSRVAFQISDRRDYAAPMQGAIINGANDTVAKFKTAQNCTGSFYFTPQKGNTYKAVLINTPAPYIAKLPVIYEQGYVISCKEEGGDKVHITVQSNIENSGSVYLLAHTRQVLKDFQKSYFDNKKQAEFFTDISSLGDGITHFTIFDNERRPVCERLFFKQPTKKATTQLTAAKSTYDRREKAELTIAVKDEEGNPLQANMSASVFLIDSLQQLPVDDIASYLLLYSDLDNNLIQPPLHLKTNVLSDKEALDQLMLVNGWRRFRWEDVFNNKPCFEYLPETEGQVVKAAVIRRNDGLPAKAVASFISVPGKNFILGNAVSSNDGNVNFIIKKSFQRNEMILQTANPVDDNYTFDVNPYYISNRIPVPKSNFIVSNDLINQLQQRSTYMQVENSFNLENKRRFPASGFEDTTSFYGKPDREYKLDDFTRFLTMEEVLKEFVGEITVKKQGESFFFRVKDKNMGGFFETDPMILIDGVPVFDATRMMKFDPLKINTIDVVESKYFHNSQVYDGIVSFRTYEGDLAGYELNPNAIVIEYNAIQKHQEYYSPQYENEQQKKSRMPDFRNVLLWQPNINTTVDGTAKINFYTSDYKGKFMVYVQGLSSSGLPVSAFSFIAVAP